MKTSSIVRFFETDKALSLVDFVLLLGPDTDLEMLYDYLVNPEVGTSKPSGATHFVSAMLKYSVVYQSDMFEVLTQKITSITQLSELYSMVKDDDTYISKKVCERFKERIEELTPNLKEALGDGIHLISSRLIGRMRELLKTNDNSILQFNARVRNSYLTYPNGGVVSLVKPFGEPDTGGYSCERVEVTDDISDSFMFQPIKSLLVEEGFHVEEYELPRLSFNLKMEDIKDLFPYHLKGYKTKKKLARIETINCMVEFILTNEGRITKRYKTNTNFESYTKCTTKGEVRSVFGERIKEAVEAKVTQKLAGAFQDKIEIKELTSTELYELLKGNKKEEVTSDEPRS